MGVPVYKEVTDKIAKTKLDIESLYNNCSIENNVIKDIDVEIIAHFGHVVSVNMLCDNIRPLPLYNSTHNVGYIIRVLVWLFDKEQEDGISLKELIGTPLRIVYVNNRAIALGHFMKDRFVLIDDLMKVEE